MLYRQNRKRTYSIALLLSVTFLLQYALTPNVFTYNINRSDHKNYQPLTQYGEVFMVKDYTGSQLLSNTEISYIVVRNLKDFQRLLSRPSDIVILPIFAFFILLIYISTYNKKRQRRLSVMAASLGGHAPPAGLFSYL